MNWTFIYNTMLFALTVEEICTVILSIWDRPISNIILQVYPSFVLIGNLEEILKYLKCQIKVFKISIPSHSINILIQILYQLLIFLILLFDTFFLIDNKTFDERKTLLLIPEKYKLIFANGFLGGIVNMMSIANLIRRKCYEEAEGSLNDFHEV